MDYKKTKSTIDLIKSKPVQIAEFYQYPRTIIDNQLNWTSYGDAVCKQTNQRLSFLMKLQQFHRSYQAIQSVI